MQIKVEPKDFLMYSVFLIFDEEASDAEDEAVKTYLAERGLEPKRVSKTVQEDRGCEVMYFGGCYLGGHLNAIGQIQRRVVDRELLAAEIPSLLRQGPDAEARARASSTRDGELQEAVEKLVDEYHVESSFGLDDEGLIQVTLDAEPVQARFLDLMADSPSGHSPVRAPIPLSANVWPASDEVRGTANNSTPSPRITNSRPCS